MIPIKIVPIKVPIRTKTKGKIPGPNRINIGPGQEPTSPQPKQKKMSPGIKKPLLIS
jgi:hypothetical protein